MKSKNFLISLVALIASFAGGRIVGSTDIAMIVFCAVIGYWILVTLTALGKKKEVAQIEAKWQQIDAVDKRYKQLAEQLTADHSHEQQTMLASLANGNTEEQTEQLKQQYAEKFEHLRGDYKKEAETILDDAAVKTLRGWRSNYLLIAVLMIGALSMLGKMVGGWIARWMGIVKMIVLVLLVLAACFFFRNQGTMVLLAALFAVNCTMPVTLYLINVVLPGKEGLAFGLLAAALIPGYLLAFCL